jgi:hypothetical protein
MAAVELALHQLQTPEVNGVKFDDVIAAGEHIPGMAALWDEATPEERREMVMLLLEPGGLYYDLELKIIAALKPRPAFLPILRMLTGVVEYDEARGILVIENWQDRNRRAPDYLQDDQRDRRTQSATFSSSYTSLYLLLTAYSRTDISSSQDRAISEETERNRSSLESKVKEKDHAETSLPLSGRSFSEKTWPAAVWPQ